MPPYTISKEMNEILRNLKKTTNDDRKQIKKKVEYEFPGSSDEIKAAITFKRMSPKLVHDLKQIQSKKLDYYSEEHYDPYLALMKKNENKKNLKQQEHLIYGLDGFQTLKNHDSSNKNIQYNSNLSLIRMKEKSNPKDKTLFKADFIKTNLNTSGDGFSSTMKPLGSRLTVSSMKDFSKFTDAPQIKNSKRLTGTIGNDMYFSTNQSTIKDSKNKRNPWIKFECSHPGIWTKMNTEKADEGEEVEEAVEGEGGIEAWSCCISTDRYSQVS